MRKLLLVPAVVAAFIAVSPASAQSVTPSQIFQEAEAINAQLATFHTANASTPTDDPDLQAVTNRLPRHVFQKAREVLLKTQGLRALKGLPEQPIPVVEVREVLPADTIQLLKAISTGLQDLRPAFGNPPQPAPVPLVDGKSPTDAYKAVAKASLSLDGLGLPPATPNEVYRLALTLVSDIDKIRAARGVSAVVPQPDPVSGKKPVDVYEIGYQLLTDLKTLVEGKADYAVPQGIVLPAKRTGAIKPSHASEMINVLLAEVSSIKAKVGATKPSDLAPPQNGKTPSDTYQVLMRARAMLAGL